MAPIWDGNETWLVVAGVVLWGAFPIVYATLFSAFYLPLLVMLAGLILRGVAFEFRYKAERMRLVWDFGFAGGSLAAAFIQGLMVGALGRRASDRRRPLCRRRIWLAQSVRADLRRRALSRLYAARRLLAGAEMRRRHSRTGLPSDPLFIDRLLVFLIVVFAYALAVDLRVIGRWLERPYLFVFPGDRHRGGDRACRQRAAAPRRTAVLHGLADFYCGLRHAGHLVLALHDSLLHHRRASGGAALEFGFHVLGRRPVRLSADLALYRRQLHRVPRQDRLRVPGITNSATAVSASWFANSGRER